MGTPIAPRDRPPLLPIRIFLSSPGDLAPMRDAAKRLVEDLNRDPRYENRYKFILYAWEDRVPPIAGQPLQRSVDQYNLLPDAADIFLCLFWKRLGSPTLGLPPDPDTGQPYLSGTVYELLTTYRATAAGQGPVILLYRCTAPAQDPALQTPDQEAALDRFLARFQAGGDLTAFSPTPFVGAADFVHIVGEDLTRVIEVELQERLSAAARHGEFGPPFDLALLPLPFYFVGRERELAWLRARLLARGSATGIAALGGIGGIGKTGLAAKVAHDLRAEGRFPDGIAVLLCQGKTTADDATQILTDVLTRFDPHRRAPDATDRAGLAEAARRLLSGKDALVVLDNVEPGLPIEHIVAPLREAGVTLLLTARQVLPAEAVPPQGRLRLDLLSETEALDLLAQSLGVPAALDLPHPTHVAAQRIVRALGRHTLAVTLASAYVADVGRDLERLASELEDPQRALQLPKGDVPDAVKRVFASSYETLSGEAQRLFVALAAVPTAEFGRDAALSLARHLALIKPEASVDLLVRRALATAEEGERLRLHLLIQALAASEFAAWPEEQQARAHGAVADHYAAYAAEFSRAAKALDEANIIGALEWAHGEHADEVVVALCEAMRTFWPETGRTRASLAYLPWGIAAAEQALGVMPDEQDHESLSAWQRRAGRLFWLLLSEGFAFQVTGALHEAVQRYDRCLTLARQARSRREEGTALHVLGQIAQRHGQLEEAEAFLKNSLAIGREVQDRRGEGADLAILAQIALQRGRLDEAEMYLKASLAIGREVQDRQGEGSNIATLGQIAQQRGQLEEAEAYLKEGLALHREVQDRQNEGVDLGALGQIALRRGQLEEAEAYLKEGLVICREVQDRRGEGVHLTTLGQIALQRGHLEEAEANLKSSLAIDREVQDQHGEGVDLASLGQIAGARGRLGEAEAYYRHGRAMLRDVHDAANCARVTYRLAILLIEELNQREEGCQLLSEAIRLYEAVGMPEEADARESAHRLGCQS